MFMIGRAIFWIGLVWLLIPHEPDVGLGNPGVARSNLRQSIVAHADEAAARLDHRCDKNELACTRAARFFSMLAHQARTRSLADVKAEIAASIRTRELQQKGAVRNISG
jgi:hypothetical protein